MTSEIALMVRHIVGRREKDGDVSMLYMENSCVTFTKDFMGGHMISTSKRYHWKNQVLSKKKKNA